MVLEFSEVLENETLTLGWKLTVNFINFQKKKKWNTQNWKDYN